QRSDGCGDRAFSFKRERIGGRAFRYHTHDSRLQIQSVTNRAARADARTLADGHVNDIQVGDLGEKLEPVGGNAFDDVVMVGGDEVPSMLGGEFLRVLFGFLKVAAELDEI